MLAQHFHHAAARSELTAIAVLRKVFTEPDFLADFINRLKAVGLRLVRPEDTEIVHVRTHNFPDEIAESRNISRQSCAGFPDLDRRIPKIGHIERFANKPAVGDRVWAHPPIYLG